MKRLAFIALSTTLLLGACGGDGGDSGNDQQVAERAIAAFERALRDEGFERAADDDDDEENLQFGSAECQAFDAAFPQGDQDLPGETASVESDRFERGELEPDGVQESVKGSLGFVSEETELREFFSLFEDDRLPRCLEEAFRQGVEESAAEDRTEFELGEIDVDTLASDRGAQRRAISMKSSISVGPATIPFLVEIELVRVGRGAAFVILSAVGPERSSADRGRLIDILVDELERH